jgi:hypothetical protein
MSSYTVRINVESKEMLELLSSMLKLSQTKTMQKLLEEAYRKMILEQANLAYARINADDDARREQEQERNLWDRTIMDGLK